MNNLQYKKGLLYASIELKYKEKSIIIDDDELVKATGYGGMICYSVRKKIDEIRCENLVLKDFKLDFGVIDPNDRVSGLIGLDFLIDAKSIIDLVDLTIYEKDI